MKYEEEKKRYEREMEEYTDKYGPVEKKVRSPKNLKQNNLVSENSDSK